MPHSGRYAANLGPFGALGFLSQTFPTTAGTTYTLSYWLANDSGTPNQFEALINGTVIPGSQLLNVDGFPYTHYVFTFVATGSSTQLMFGYRQDPAYFHLDDVSVSPTGPLTPVVVSSTLTGTLLPPVDHARLGFNEPIDPNSFTFDQFALVDPNGNQVNVQSITPVGGTGNTQFDVTFDSQSTLGMYTLTVGPNIMDVLGNRMTAPFIGNFTISTELIVNGGFETGNFNGWSTQTAPSGSDYGVFAGSGHTGTYAAEFGAIVEDSYDQIWQDLTTTPGATYTISFWLGNNLAGTSGFIVSWGGTTLLELEDPAPFAYTLYTYTMVATASTTRLEFEGYQVPSFYLLDDVSVSRSPAPAPHGGRGGTGAFGGAVLVPGQAPVVGTGVLLGQPLGSTSPGGRAGNPQSTWEAHRAGLLDQVFASLKSTDAGAAIPAGIIGSGVNVDPLAWDRLGKADWSLQWIY
jgi:hypothetical protein